MSLCRGLLGLSAGASSASLFGRGLKLDHSGCRQPPKIRPSQGRRPRRPREHAAAAAPSTLTADRKQFMVDGQAAILEVLDTAGIDQYLALHDLFMRESDGFVLVFS